MAHPKLAENVIERMMAFGSVEELHADQVLYEPNQTAVNLYLLIHGQFEHFAPTLDGRDEVAFTFKAGEFSGEMDLVMNHRSLLGLRTTSGFICVTTPVSAFSAEQKAKLAPVLAIDDSRWQRGGCSEPSIATRAQVRQTAA